MSATFQSRWSHFRDVKTFRVATDKTDKSPSVSFVSSHSRGIEGESGPSDSDPAAAWGENAATAAWFLSREPPERSFALQLGVTILDPSRWWASMIADIKRGPGVGRDHAGAVRLDLRRAKVALDHLDAEYARVERAAIQNESRDDGTAA